MRTAAQSRRVAIRSVPRPFTCSATPTAASIGARRNTSYVERDADAGCAASTITRPPSRYRLLRRGDSTRHQAGLPRAAAAASASLSNRPSRGASRPRSAARSEADRRRAAAGAARRHSRALRRQVEDRPRRRRRDRCRDRRAARRRQLSLPRARMHRPQRAGRRGCAARSRPLRLVSAGIDVQARDRRRRARQRTRTPATRLCLRVSARTAASARGSRAGIGRCATTCSTRGRTAACRCTTGWCTRATPISRSSPCASAPRR